MDRKQLRWVLALAMTAGFAGGMVSDLLFDSQPAFAKKASGRPPVVSAREFRLVDDDGKTRARLHLIPKVGGSSLTLMDEEGRKRLELSLNAKGEPRLTFKDPEGRDIAEFGQLFGKTNLRLEGKDGTRVAVMGGPRPGVAIFNQNSRLIWSAP